MPRISGQGFSLVELSIVLVILGLLTGGILAGQSLIRASEIRAVSSEHGKYTSSIYTFRDKYMAWPGDMPNATAFWGKDNAVCSSQTGTVATPGTCNGNGDGLASSATTVKEDHRFWQHLANAGLIEGTYTGVSTGSYYTAGVNAPPSKLPNAFWGTDGSATADPGGVAYFPQKAGNYLGLWSANMDHLAPGEAWNIDTKLDDGKPGVGKILSNKGGASTPCTSVANTATTVAQDAAATYTLTATGKYCELNFMLH